MDSRECVMERGPDGQQRLKQITLHCELEGTSDDETARDLVERSTSTTYDELVRSDIRVEPDVVDTITGTGVWDVEIDYIREEKTELEIGESTYTFDTTGGTQHITQSLETMHRDWPGVWKAPDFKGAIRAKREEGKLIVEGVDIGHGVYEWGETHYLPDKLITEAYKVRLSRLTYKTNDSPWRGFEIGEVLFRGARGGKRGREDWEISFGFAASENKKNWLPPSLIDVGVEPGFDPFDKGGWDYLWILYEEVEDAVAKVLVTRPRGLYVERVYEAGDFSKLGI